MQDASQKGLSAAPAGQTASSSSGNVEPTESARSRKSQASPGLEFPRFFTAAGSDPFDVVEWELRDAIIGNEKGTVVFEQRGVEIPKSWSQLATDIVVSKLKRLNQNDIDDIKAMAGKNLLDHKKLVSRFESAVDRFSTDARAEDLPTYIRNLNRIERDFLGVPESRIELPGWME